MPRANPCLRSKTLFVDLIRDIEWSGDPFSMLVLSDGYKGLLLSFVKTHVGGEKTFGDVIHGKGKPYHCPQRARMSLTARQAAAL